MEKTTIELTKLTASEGMMLTNGEVYSKEVYLGINDSADDWYEVTEAEYQNAVKKQYEALGIPTEEIEAED